MAEITLAKKAGFCFGVDRAIKLIENITGEITFKNCARSAKTILDIREGMMNKLRELI